MTYFALWDNQNGGYMHSGRNDTSLKELKESLLSYLNGEIGDGSPEDVALGDKMDAYELAELADFSIVTSNTRFEEDDEVDGFWNF